MKFLLVLAAALCAASLRAQVPSYKIVVLPAHFSDQAVNLLPSQAAIQATFDAAGKVWNDAAGSTVFTTDLAAPFMIPHLSTITGCPVDWMSTAAVTAANAGHNGAKAAYFSTTGGGCPYGGDAPKGGSTLNLYILNANTIAHEEGHMLGLDHALSVTFDGAFGDFAHARYGAYGDKDSVMAAGSYATGYDLWLLGWFRPPEIARGAATTRFHITPGPRGGVFIRRDDRLVWYLETPSAGAAVRLRSSSIGTTSYGASGFGTGDYSYWGTLAAGQDIRDEFGGVELKMVDATTADISSFTPTSLQPTPHAVPTVLPPVLPTPAVDPAGDCWVLKPYLRCTPTPTVTPTSPPTSTPTPRPPTPTRTSTPPPSATTIVPTPTLSPPPVIRPSPTPAPPVTPPMSTPAKAAVALTGLAAIGAALKKFWAWIKKTL